MYITYMCTYVYILSLPPVQYSTLFTHTYMYVLYMYACTQCILHHIITLYTYTYTYVHVYVHTCI